MALERVMSWDDLVLVGRIVRPHGLRGELVVQPETDFVERRFAVGSSLCSQGLEGEERLAVTAMRVHGGRPIVRFAGIESIEQAEQYVGRELRVAEEELQPLGAGAFYHHQLTGCVVETLSGVRVGTVVRVEGGLGGSRLVIDGPRGEVLVPLVEEICADIDVAHKRIRVDPPEGLLELNER